MKFECGTERNFARVVKRRTSRRLAIDFWAVQEQHCNPNPLTLIFAFHFAKSLLFLISVIQIINHLLNFNYEVRSWDQNWLGREKNKDGNVELFKHMTHVSVAEKQGFSTEWWWNPQLLGSAFATELCWIASLSINNVEGSFVDLRAFSDSIGVSLTLLVHNVNNLWMNQCE